MMHPPCKVWQLIGLVRRITLKLNFELGLVIVLVIVGYAESHRRGRVWLLDVYVCVECMEMGKVG